MGNKGSRKSAKYLPSPSETVETFLTRSQDGITLNVEEADLLQLRDLFCVHAVDDQVAQVSYLDRQSFENAINDLHGNQFDIFHNIPTNDKEMREVLATVLFEHMNFEQDGKMQFHRFIIGMGTCMKGKPKDMLRFAFTAITHGTGKKHVTEEIILNYMERNMKLLTSAKVQQFMVNRSYLSARSMITGLGRTVEEDMDTRLKAMVQEKVGLAIYELKSKQATVAKRAIEMLSAFQQSPGDLISYDVFERWACAYPHFMDVFKPSELAAKLIVAACSGVPSDAATVNKTCAKLSKIEALK